MRMFKSFICAAAFAFASLSASEAAAPSPAKPVELQRYVGRWYEVARVPNHFENGAECQAPTADYRQDDKGAVTVVQTCHQNFPRGPRKTYHATARILDPGANAKFRLTFFLVVNKDYWVLDHADDYRWAIVGDPTGEYLWLFSRQPDASNEVKNAMVARARTLGYDTHRLEFPAQG